MQIPTIIRRRPVVVGLVIVVLLPLVVFTIWTMITLSYTYSSGERAGFLQKISKRGWLCKTWEGELQMVAVPGSTPEKFLFTTRSDSIAAELSKLAGQRVVLNYKEHRGVPGSCFGDTDYFVVGARAGTP